jgi:hypothetical protein
VNQLLAAFQLTREPACDVKRAGFRWLISSATTLVDGCRYLDVVLVDQVKEASKRSLKENVARQQPAILQAGDRKREIQSSHSSQQMA